MMQGSRCRSPLAPVATKIKLWRKIFSFGENAWRQLFSSWPQTEILLKFIVVSVCELSVCNDIVYSSRVNVTRYDSDKGEPKGDLTYADWLIGLSNYRRCLHACCDILIVVSL